MEIHDLQKIDFNNKFIEVLGYVQKAQFCSPQFAYGYILGSQSGRVHFYSPCAEAIALIKDAYQNQRQVLVQGRGVDRLLQIDDVILQLENQPSSKKKES